MSVKAYLTAAAIAAGALVTLPAAATTFTYSSFTVVNNTGVTITGPGVNETGGSGQIDLTGSGANAGQTLAVWCIDITHNLTGTGTFTFTAPPTSNGSPAGPALTNTQIGEIGGLISFGNAHINDSTAMSSATQLAIWTVEYGSTYTLVSSSSAVTTELGVLLADLGNGTISSSYDWWNALTEVNGSGVAIDQGQATLVPEPASLAVLGFSMLGLGALRRRRG